MRVKGHVGKNWQRPKHPKGSEWAAPLAPGTCSGSTDPLLRCTCVRVCVCVCVCVYVLSVYSPAGRHLHRTQPSHACTPTLPQSHSFCWNE